VVKKRKRENWEGIGIEREGRSRGLPDDWLICQAYHMNMNK
jgi:hypothetical protein